MKNLLKGTFKVGLSLGIAYLAGIAYQKGLEAGKAKDSEEEHAGIVGLGSARRAMETVIQTVIGRVEQMIDEATGLRQPSTDPNN